MIGSIIACRVLSFYLMAPQHGDVTSILETERIAPKVQTHFPFDVLTCQYDDYPLTLW